MLESSTTGLRRLTSGFRALGEKGCTLKVRSWVQGVGVSGLELTEGLRIQRIGYAVQALWLEASRS